MMELMESLEYVRAYIDDLLCISRNRHEDHLEKLEEVLRGSCDAGLKVNADKSTFCEIEIEYLGYVLTKDEIKPQSNKGAGNTCNSTAQRSEITKTYPRHGTILPRPLGKMERHAHPSHCICWRVWSD
jgi:hypothetical protein